MHAHGHSQLVRAYTALWGGGILQPESMRARERASERGERERERERERGRERSRERERARASCLKCVLLITLLAPGKHTPTYPASSAPDTRCRRALPKPCNVGPDAAAPPPRPRRHRTPPNARHPRPHDPGPRTPPPQRPRAPARHRTAPRPTAHKLGPGKTRPAGERPRHSRARRIRAARTTSGPAADHRVRAWPPAPAAHAPVPAAPMLAFCSSQALDIEVPSRRI